MNSTRPSDLEPFAGPRMQRIALAVAALGIAAAWYLRGQSGAAGFSLGAALSLWNLRFWTRITEAIGQGGTTRPGGARAVWLGLRYIIAGVVIYVIVTVWQVSLAAILAGLFVAVAAVLIESILQLFRNR